MHYMRYVIVGAFMFVTQLVMGGDKTEKLAQDGLFASTVSLDEALPGKGVLTVKSSASKDRTFVLEYGSDVDPSKTCTLVTIIKAGQTAAIPAYLPKFLTLRDAKYNMPVDVLKTTTFNRAQVMHLGAKNGFLSVEDDGMKVRLYQETCAFIK